MQPSLFEVGIDVGLSEFATLSDDKNCKPQMVSQNGRKVSESPANIISKKVW